LTGRTGPVGKEGTTKGKRGERKESVGNTIPTVSREESG